MLTRVWLGPVLIPLAKLPALGQGGEADVFELDDGRALKVFKTPDHPDVAGVPALEAAALHRLREHEDKLAAFPRALPPHVVRPQELATRTKRGRDVVGYAMAKVDGVALASYAEPRWRRDHPTDANDVVAALRHLHLTVDAVHRAGVVIGDFNDHNVLVAGGRCWLIDADSWQYDRYACAMFSERFVDPRLCAPGAAAPQLARPHDVDSDWFAFAVMVFRSLLGVSPYGGVHAPADPARRIAAAARALRGVTVFDPDVVYPKAATPWQVLPDPLLVHLRAVFEGGLRGPFPVELLERLRFRRCACGVEHARPSCPVCRTAVARPAAAVRGSVRAEAVDPATLVASSWAVPSRAAAAGAPGHVFLDGGTLWRRARLGDERIGEVLAGQTRAWCGDALGVGLYRAGGYTVAFTFRPDRRGLTDQIAIPKVRGALLDVHAVCGPDRVWLWWHEALAGRHTVRCVAIAPDGRVLGAAEAAADEPGWLASVRGACAAGPYLFVPTDAGVVRVEVERDALVATRTFPDTADFVSAADRLVLVTGGLGVITDGAAWRLTLS